MTDFNRKDERREQFLRKKKYKKISTSAKVQRIKKEQAETEAYINEILSDDGEKL